MIEVFKTNVKEQDHAKMLICQIHKLYIEYKANFDLDDCDKILRVKSATGIINSSCVVALLKDFGFHAEILPDVPEPARQYVLSRSGRLSAS